MGTIHLFLHPKRSRMFFGKACFRAFFTHFRSQNHFQGILGLYIGSKWAKNTCLSIPNGPGSLLGKHIFDPFRTPFWSQNLPIFKAFGDCPWAKTLAPQTPNRLKTLF